MRAFLFIILNFLIISLHAQVTFVIESLPNTTPSSDTIFIAGTFNDWRANDTSYMLTPQLNGKYAITLAKDTGTIEFKFTRGSWIKVETNKNNELITNRSYTYGTEITKKLIVENWQDLGGAKGFNYVVFILFAIVIYASMLLLYLLRIKNIASELVKSIFIVNLNLIFFLIGLILYNLLNPTWQPILNLLAFMFLLIWGPSFFHFIYISHKKKSYSHINKHYLPSLILLFWLVLHLVNFEPMVYISNKYYGNLSLEYIILISLSLSFNFYYLLKSRKVLDIKIGANQAKTNNKFMLILIYTLNSISILLISISFFLLFYNWKLPNYFELIIIVLSSIILVEFYFYWKYPEILLWQEKIKVENNQNPDKHNIDSENKESENIKQEQSLIKQVKEEASAEVLEFEKRLIFEMETQKLFKDPDLNIAKLSKQLKVKPHFLSKVLNDQFNKNFRDFINEYRINEFIELAISERYRNFTFLALSYEVGFNSKSTFNLAFKKFKGLSPGSYLKENFIIEKA